MHSTVQSGKLNQNCQSPAEEGEVFPRALFRLTSKKKKPGGVEQDLYKLTHLSYGAATTGLQVTVAWKITQLCHCSTGTVLGRILSSFKFKILWLFPVLKYSKKDVLKNRKFFSLLLLLLLATILLLL